MSNNLQRTNVAVIANDPIQRLVLKRKLGQGCTVRCFESPDALNGSKKKIAFALVDSKSPADATRLERACCRALPDVPTLIISERPSTKSSAGVRHISAELLSDELRVELGRALVTKVVEHKVVADAIVELARQHKLTPRQMELVAYWTLPLRRARIAEILEVEESTVKTRVRILLRRFDASSTDEVAKRLLARALTLGLGAQKASKAKRA